MDAMRNSIKLLLLAAFGLACLLAACAHQGTQKAQPLATYNGPPPKTLAEFEKATAGLGPTAIGHFVLKNYGCAECHTLADDGKFGLTAKGETGAESFEGCKPLLANANVAALVPEAKRTAADQKQFKMFQEFGCAFCHQIKPGSTGFTEIGAKLGFFHLGCFEGICCDDEDPTKPKKAPEKK